MLIHLSNGDWVNPEVVDSVVVENCFSGPEHSFVVVVSYGDDVSICDAKTKEQAVVIRDKLAEQINKALYEGGK